MLDYLDSKNLQLMAESTEYNKIKKSTNIIFNTILIFLSFVSVIPFVFVIIISFTDEQVLASSGYKFIPQKLSLYAYKYILSTGSSILKSYGVTILVTVLGTIIGLFLMSTYAYAISRKSYKYRSFFTKLATIPMLFSGGMVSSYLINTRLLMLKNTIWALILPLAVNTFNIIILRTFIKTSIPESVIESAKIDGASEWELFFKIILPISLPGLATIALFLILGYWNDWFNAMLYIDDNNLVPLQYLMIKIESSIEFLTNNKSQLSNIDVALNLPKETIKMAIVVISTIPIIFAYPFFQRYFVNGLTIGSVKE